MSYFLWSVSELPRLKLGIYTVCMNEGLFTYGIFFNCAQWKESSMHENLWWRLVLQVKRGKMDNSSVKTCCKPS